MQDLPKAYNPKEVEEKWLKIWLDQKLFKSKVGEKKENFSIALPPPNVTGNLHMGHAFGDIIQDVLIRYNKMLGKNVLWQGGTDHAGIATQVLVERELARSEKKRKEDIGREEFLKRVWQWREKHGNEIIDQMQKLGCALDYDRLVFTMDEHYTKAIRKVFVELYKKGLIYRGKRIVNWCPKCLTSISDLEVETETTDGKLYYILYPFDISNIAKGGITVATTRPETMFGDIAVAVNPEDVRYKKLVGSKVYLPLINKQIPVISDVVIKMDFGTGAVKTTPAHDANDYEIFERNKGVIQKFGTHFFPYPVILSTDGKVQDNNNLGIPHDIVGLDRYKARELILSKLEELGLLKQVSEYDQILERHDRCSTILEPYLSEQWYVEMSPLAKHAISAVENKKIKFTPERYTEHYLHWLKNVKDWCISRQLWWGHQIPVWYCKSCNHINVALETPESCLKCKSRDLVQDPDVLDTWFSSALWPFVTLGWPILEDQNYLRAFYPTSVLATAREIINLWVSRMVFMGLEFAGDIPFKEVIIHPVIQTPDGKRMSKSKGNAIDPNVLIEKYGADANRFWYFSLGVTGNQDVRFPGRKSKDGEWESDVLEQYKRFANKLWNAVRFVLQNLDIKTVNVGAFHEMPLTIADRWILHKYTELVFNVRGYFYEYRFSDITDSIYKFIWDEFCDWYVEIAKRQLASNETKGQTQFILFYIVCGITKALHPIMPFITEEIWQVLQNTQHSFLFNERYPNPDVSLLNKEADKSFSHVIETTRAIRNMRQLLGIQWTKEIEARLFTQSNFEKSALESSTSYIENLTKSKVVIRSDYEPFKPSTGALILGTRILIPLSGLVDLEGMLNSLNKKRGQFKSEIQSQEAKLNNTGFINSAPQDKIDEVRKRLVELNNQIKAIDEQIELLR